MRKTQKLSVAIALFQLGAFAASNSFAQDYYLAEQPSASQSFVHPIEQPANGHSQSELTLESLVGMAYASNPTIAQAQAQIEAAKGTAYQAGLRPNPVVGYVAEQIGVNGTAGELQGGFISQEFVRGNKLALSQAKYCQRVKIAETNLQAQLQRVLNDVKIRFYHTLAAQQLMEVQQRLLDNAKDNVQTHNEMLNLGQLGEAEVLQAEVDQQRAELTLKNARNDYQQSWRELMSFVGTPHISQSFLDGTLQPQSEPLDWNSAIAELFANSPDLIAAQQKIHHDQIAVRREQAEPIPNLTVDVSVGYNAEVDQTVTGVTAGFPLPVFNRNRGTIRQANADLSRAYSEVERLQLDLQSQLSIQFRDYVSAWQHVVEYEQTMLPKSRKAVDLLDKMYKERRAPWTSVLTARQMLLELEKEQINNLLAYQKADIVIRGNLLMGGLTEPAGPISGGHIDAVAQPR